MKKYKNKEATMKLFFYFLCLISFCGCQTSHFSKRAIIVDTDMGNDDWMALLYLLKHPKADLKGITVNGAGLSEIDPALQHAVKLQEIAGTIKKKSVPLAKGPAQAWKQKNPYPTEWQKRTNEFYGMDRKIHYPLNIQKESAAQFLVNLAKEFNNLEILALGSLTNIADAIKLDTSFVNKVKRIVIMGGAINVPGNVNFAGYPDNTFAEFNIFADPEAAEFVFKSGIEIYLIPLDSTNHVLIDKAMVERFKKKRQTPSLNAILHIFQEIKNKLIDPGYFYAWDPLAAVALMENDFYNWEFVKLSVNTESGSHYGQTFKDQNGSKMFFLVPKTGFNLKQEWESHYLKRISP